VVLRADRRHVWRQALKRGGPIKRKAPLRAKKPERSKLKRIPLAIKRPSEMRRVPKFLCEDGVFRYPDGREVCSLATTKGAHEYLARKLDMWIRQSRRCFLQISDQCKAKKGRWNLDLVVFGHESPRGMGGGSQDDRIVIDGKPHNYAICVYCNNLQGSKRIPHPDILDAI
jgi:hypothetical protein